MGLKNTTNAYGSVARFLHWTIALLVVVLLIVGYTMLDIEDKEVKVQVINIHKLTGILVLALMVLRVLWAMINIKPSLPFGTPAWEKMAEKGMHYLLYLGLIVMPLSGWLGSVWGGRLPHIGEFQFSLPIVANKDLSEFAFDDVHIPLAIILIVLISLHVLAALYHHVIKKDNILRRMISG